MPPESRIDTLARALATRVSRRRALAVAGGTALGAVGFGLVPAVAKADDCGNNVTCATKCCNFDQGGTGCLAGTDWVCCPDLGTLPQMSTWDCPPNTSCCQVQVPAGTYNDCCDNATQMCDPNGKGCVGKQHMCCNGTCC